MRRLIVTADDVGLDRGMTAGAIEAHRNGIVTACSIVANGREFEDAVGRLHDCPALEIGVHLTLVEERSLTTGEHMPKNWVRFLFSRRGDVEGEMDPGGPSPLKHARRFARIGLVARQRISAA